MRKALCVLIILTTYNFAHSQDEEKDYSFSKGSNVLGGGVSILNYEDDHKKYLDSINSTQNRQYRGFAFSPTYSHYVNDDLAVGIRLTFRKSESISNNNSSRYESNYTHEDKSSGIDIYTLHNFKIFKNIGFYLSPAIGYSRIDNTDLDSSISLSDPTDINRSIRVYKGNQYQALIDFGLYYRLGEKIMIQAQIAEAKYSTRSLEGTTTNLINNTTVNKIDDDRTDLTLNLWDNIGYNKLLTFSYIF